MCPWVVSLLLEVRWSSVRNVRSCILLRVTSVRLCDAPPLARYKRSGPTCMDSALKCSVFLNPNFEIICTLNHLQSLSISSKLHRACISSITYFIFWHKWNGWGALQENETEFHCKSFNNNLSIVQYRILKLYRTEYPCNPLSWINA